METSVFGPGGALNLHDYDFEMAQIALLSPLKGIMKPP